jgi:hypothetical protein
VVEDVAVAGLGEGEAGAEGDAEEKFADAGRRFAAAEDEAVKSVCCRQAGRHFPCGRLKIPCADPAESGKGDARPARQYLDGFGAAGNTGGPVIVHRHTIL